MKRWKLDLVVLVEDGRILECLLDGLVVEAWAVDAQG